MSEVLSPVELLAQEILGLVRSEIGQKTGRYGEGARSSGLRDYVFSLTAGQEQTRDIPGNWFHVLSATGDITIRFDEGSGLARTQGQGGQQDYSKVTLLSATTQVVRVALGYGEATDARATVSANLTTSIDPSNVVTGLADVTVGVAATLIAAASATGRFLLVSISENELGAVRIGGAGVTAAAGFRLAPGDSMLIPHNDVIYAIRESVDVVVNVSRFDKV